MFQDFALLPWCTVAQNVEFPLLHIRLTAADRRAIVEDALHRTGLADFRGTYPKQLSGGMRQRVGIARALAVRPAILLMDEPLSALDSQTRELLMEDFIGLLADGTMGAVYVTHNLEEAVRLADRIVVLSRRPGRVRDVVSIAMTRGERGDINARGRLLALQDELWSLIREEAIRCRARGPACLSAPNRRRGRSRVIPTASRGGWNFAAPASRRSPAVVPAGSRWRW